LDELKQLINHAAARHAELRAELVRRTDALNRAARRLRRAEFFIIRLFTERSIPNLVDAANLANDELDEARAHLEGCFVEVDFAFDGGTNESYAALIRAFEDVRTAQRIWDITATAGVDRVRQRTTAFNAITRVPVSFGFSDSEIIRTTYRAMRLGNVGGRDLQIFPGFIMMREASGDFALIEFAEFECQLAQSRFIEEESVPTDAEQVGTTWKRANKDGSRDRRFADNYQIPVMRYGALAFSSPTGLAEVYQVSSYDRAARFAHALAAHKHSLANLTTPTDLPALTIPTSGDEAGDENTAPEPAFAAKPRKNLALDWATLLLILVGFGVGGLWVVQHRNDLVAAIAPPPTATPTLSAAPASEEKHPVAASRASHSKTHRHHKHGHRPTRKRTQP
jgi:hypothetical protein